MALNSLINWIKEEKSHIKHTLMVSYGQLVALKAIVASIMR